MTLDEAVTALRGWTGDFTGLVHGETDAKDLLEQAANEVAALTLCYERTRDFTDADSPEAFEAGSREYLLAGTVGELGLGITDSLKVISVHLNGKALVQITPQEYEIRSVGHPGSGEPRYWYEFAGYLGLTPIPDAAFLADYLIEISYAAAPVTWTSGESVLPPAFQGLILPFAYAKAMAREGMWTEMATAYAQWFSQIQTQPLTLLRPATHQSQLDVPSTERRRLGRRVG